MEKPVRLIYVILFETDNVLKSTCILSGFENAFDTVGWKFEPE